MGKWVNNFRVQTAFPERETEIERRGRDFEAGREKFCRSYLCWAPGEARKTQKGPLATKTGVALEEGRSRVEGLELWPSALARSERTPGRRLSGGRTVQRFPAREERGSDSTLPRWSQPARLRARARLSLRSGNRVLAPKTSHPSPALSVFLLNARIDNGWQLPALHTQVRPASPSAQPNAHQSPFSAMSRSRTCPAGAAVCAGLARKPRTLNLIKSGRGCARSSREIEGPVNWPTGSGAG